MSLPTSVCLLTQVIPSSFPYWTTQKSFFLSSISSLLMPFMGKWHQRAIVISYISVEMSTFLLLLRFTVILNFINTVQFCFHFCAITRFLGKRNASNFKLSVLCNELILLTDHLSCCVLGRAAPSTLWVTCCPWGLSLETSILALFCANDDSEHLWLTNAISVSLVPATACAVPTQVIKVFQKNKPATK